MGVGGLRRFSLEGSRPQTPNTDYVAASGFVYPTSAAVPEPSTWAMMLVGFAGLAWIGHRAARTSVAKST
jgi:hypothetical protein